MLRQLCYCIELLQRSKVGSLSFVPFRAYQEYNLFPKERRKLVILAICVSILGLSLLPRATLADSFKAGVYKSVIRTFNAGIKLSLCSQYRTGTAEALSCECCPASHCCGDVAAASCLTKHPACSEASWHAVCFSHCCFLFPASGNPSRNTQPFFLSALTACVSVYSFSMMESVPSKPKWKYW